jgi:acyl-CoA synthetase (AMP-forming)/AMP-acid ligase II
MSNLASNLVANARRMPDRVAVINGDVMTYAKLDAATSRFAPLLGRSGVGPAIRSGSCCRTFRPCRSSITASFGSGGPMNPLMRSRELEFCLARDPT